MRASLAARLLVVLGVLGRYAALPSQPTESHPLAPVHLAAAADLCTSDHCNDPSQSADIADHAHFPAGKLLPSVQCIWYLALNGSSSAPLFETQMKALGIWDRVTVQVAEADPDGKAAGCFRAHVKAWNDALDAGCETALLLEEDLYFNEPVVEAALTHADTFIKSNASFDMLFLGYTPQVNFTADGFPNSPWEDPASMMGSVATYDDNVDKCVYRLHLWLCTQSYIISRPTMERWRGMTYVVNETPPIDFWLSTYFDNDGFFAVRPMVGFQRYHAPVKGQSGTVETGSPMETFKMIPGVVYSVYDPELFGKANITSPPECLPPYPSAYSYQGLDDQLKGLTFFNKLQPLKFPYATPPLPGTEPFHGKAEPLHVEFASPPPPLPDSGSTLPDFGVGTPTVINP